MKYKKDKCHYKILDGKEWKGKVEAKEKLKKNSQFRVPGEEQIIGKFSELKDQNVVSTQRARENPA